MLQKLNGTFQKPVISTNKNGFRHFVSLYGKRRLMPLVEKVESHGHDYAVVNRDGRFFSYNDISLRSKSIASALQITLQSQDLKGSRLAVLCNPSENYVASQLAIWRSGGCFVPLCISHPLEEMKYVINDCNISAVITEHNHLEKANDLNLPIIVAENCLSSDTPADSSCKPEAPAMILYTSGTTGRPKGVVTRHLALEAQINDQIVSWGWKPKDRVLNCLPLHHVHGILNLTCVPLHIGACVEFIEPKTEQLWQRFMKKSSKGGPLSVFMAVPTIYSRLIQKWDEMPAKDKARATLAANDLRLMVSGSAALPTTVMEKWKQITGHTLLERYGMTEFGMGLSNPLNPIGKRLPGHVGKPMPSLEAKLINSDTGEMIDNQTGESGELCVKGPTVFKEYWNKPEATAASFDKDGWFKTGDIAMYNTEEEAYRILGRASADIIKTGGEKVSALEIERHLLEDECIAEISVLGIPDEEYGEKVAAVLKLKKGKHFQQDDFIRHWRNKIAKYKVPSVYKVLESIPKNAMGKVSKKQLRDQFFK